MGFVMVILGTMGVAAILFIAFSFGAAYEARDVVRAAEEDRPFRAGDHVYKVTALKWQDMRPEDEDQ